MLLEGQVDVLLQFGETGDLGGVFRQKRIEQRFALARGVQPPLDAEAVDQPRHAEPRGDDADRAEQRRFFGVDFVAGERQPITARRRDILGKGEDRHAFLLGELADAAEQQCRLHRRATRRVDRQRDAAETRDREGALQRGGMARQ